MEKPLKLQVDEIGAKIVNVVNESKLPAYILKIILQDIYNQIEIIEQQEIEEYQKKESEKECKK